jgi:hypothetical protein
MDIKIFRAEKPEEIKQFIDFPHLLYKGNPNYVPELYISQKKLFSKKLNPFFKHSDAEFFLAKENDKIVGRIAVINNRKYLELSDERNAFFGFFDVVNNYEVAEILLKTAMNWAKENYFSGMQGPVNFSMNDTCGLLIEGFNSPPSIMMTYQTSYHKEFLERFGFNKKMDLLAYCIKPDTSDEKVIRLKDALEERLRKRGITIRNLNLKNFSKEVSMIREIYNSAWEKNWGFVPMTNEEFDFAACDMKSIVDTDFAYIAEHKGKAIGFSLTIPNLNEVFIRMHRGRLFPTGLFKFLYFKNKVRSARILTLGVIKEYRNAGIDACFYARNIETARRKDIRWAEASWILENNELMNRALVNIGGEVYKKYRIYELATS